MAVPGPLTADAHMGPTDDRDISVHGRGYGAAIGCGKGHIQSPGFSYPQTVTVALADTGIVTVAPVPGIHIIYLSNTLPE